MKVVLVILTLSFIVSLGCVSMSEKKIFNIIEDVLNRDHITILFMEELLGKELQERRAGASVFSSGARNQVYESEEVAGTGFSFQLRINKDASFSGVLVMKPSNSAINQAEILNRIEGVRYVVIPSFETGTETVSYKVNGKEVFFEFESSTDSLNFISIHF